MKSKKKINENLPRYERNSIKLYKRKNKFREKKSERFICKKAVRECVWINLNICDKMKKKGHKASYSKKKINPRFIPTDDFKLNY